ncbi:MAG: OmpA family protein [Pseudomonadota bacterium]|nr:OmpA family protein [Pseudomonadota bacterium]
MRASSVLALLGAACIFSSSAFAEEYKEMRPYFTESLTYTFADSERNADDAWGGYIGLGSALTEYWGLEAGLFYQAFPMGGNSDPNRWEEWGVEANALYFYSRKPSFSPYFKFGLGTAWTDLETPAGDADTRQPFYQAGLGFMSAFKYFTLRGDVAYRYTDAKFSGFDDFQEPQLRLGIAIPIGKAEVAEADDTMTAPVTDSDGDGVLDDRDQCPGTPRGVRVDAKGCPIDTDGDGVPDYLDKCPATPAGTPVDSSGCPLATKVDRKFEDVNFGFDRFDLTDYARVTLDKTAAEINTMVQKNPGVRIEVEGHTDSIGTNEYNQALGVRRATAVKDYLIRKGVSGDVITTRSYGETKPIATNDTAKGRLLNRRTEIRATSE